jgi:flagellar biosynthesis protein FlhF
MSISPVVDVHPSPVEATFVADLVDDAFELARRVLGPRAWIVSSRRVSRADGRPAFEVRAVVSAMTDGGGLWTSSREDEPCELARLLEQHDVPGRYAAKLISRLREAASSPRGRRGSFEAVLREHVAFDDLTGGPRVLALVGASGVGKTSVAAKLAARDAFARGRRVALISTDHRRLGGAPSLERFAAHAGIPFAVVEDGGELAQAIERSDAERIYVDTAGLSLRHARTAQSLAWMLEPVGAAIALCVSAVSACDEVLRTLVRAAVLRPRALVVTRLDEADRGGPTLFAALASGAPISHFSTGARVPHDLEVAGAGRLTELFFGAEVSR